MSSAQTVERYIYIYIYGEAKSAEGSNASAAEPQETIAPSIGNVRLRVQGYHCAQVCRWPKLDHTWRSAEQFRRDGLWRGLPEPREGAQLALVRPQADVGGGAYVYTYIYIYIYRSKERPTGVHGGASLPGPRGCKLAWP